jgi:hypothetical protein
MNNHFSFRSVEADIMLIFYESDLAFLYFTSCISLFSRQQNWIAMSYYINKQNQRARNKNL